MKRTADYTIQGFLYQFNKTLLEILKSPDEALVTVEGIIEDIDIACPDGITAIQCKYHEAQQNFALSAVAKPILQMMNHFDRSKPTGVSYRLYAYFPGETGQRPLSRQDFERILESKDKQLLPHIRTLKGSFDPEAFAKHFLLEFGEPYDSLVASVYQELVDAGMPKGEIETLIYPNAIQEIANLSTKHAENRRTVTKASFLDCLRQIRTTAVTRWTLALKTRKKVLENRRRQLKTNLDKNTRRRYFVISQQSLQNFDADIVNFISEYLEKYHFKPAHISTPVFCLDCSKEAFDNIRLRVYKKNINFEDGYVGTYFDRKKFFREPLTKKARGEEYRTEFRVRIAQYEADTILLNASPCDDLFVVGDNAYCGLEVQDINVERLGVTKFQELKYLLRMSEAYE